MARTRRIVTFCFINFEGILGGSATHALPSSLRPPYTPHIPPTKTPPRPNRSLTSPTPLIPPPHTTSPPHPLRPSIPLRSFHPTVSLHIRPPSPYPDRQTRP